MKAGARAREAGGYAREALPPPTTPRSTRQGGRSPTAIRLHAAVNQIGPVLSLVPLHLLPLRHQPLALHVLHVSLAVVLPLLPVFLQQVAQGFLNHFIEPPPLPRR